MTHIDFAFVDNVEIFSFFSLLNDKIAGEMNFRKHGIKDLGTFVFIKMTENEFDQFCSLKKKIFKPE